MPNGISIEMAVLIVVGVLAAITISSAILEHAPRARSYSWYIDHVGHSMYH